MRQVELPDGTRVPALGQGTWKMGEQPALRAREAEALLAGIDLGMTLIDTAEMYGEGRTESFLGETLQGVRDRIYLVSKVYPHNAGGRKLVQACEDSLRRLNTDHLDLYLLHWRGPVPFEETIEGMEALKAAGKIGAWGVSNLDSDDMEELLAAGGEACATNQVLYNPARRGVEFALFPALAAAAIPPMAYSPIEQGRLRETGALSQVAARHGISVHQAALAWVLRRPDVIAIPKAGTLAHVKANRAALDVALTQEDLAAIDAAFPPPTRNRPLEMI